MVSQQRSKGLGFTRTSAVPGRRDYGPWNTEIRFCLLPTPRDLTFERNLVLTCEKTPNRVLGEKVRKTFSWIWLELGAGASVGKVTRVSCLLRGRDSGRWPLLGSYSCPLVSVKNRSPGCNPDRRDCCSNLRLPEDFPQMSVKWCP